MTRRRAIALVARREIVERGRDRGFLVSSAILAVLAVGLALVPSRLDLEGSSAYRPDDVATAYALVGVLVLYGALIAYGSWVAAGVIEEKASRVVELLLATIRPADLLAGKVIGLGLLGLCQLALLYTAGIATALASGAGTVSPAALAAVPLALGWFVLGYALYSSAFALAGALASRQEQLQTTLTPLTVCVAASAFVALAALEDPDGGLARAASLFPPLAPMVMPIRGAAGVAPLWEQVLAVALVLASTAALVPLAAHAYSAALLAPGGRATLRAAWRGLSPSRR